MKNHWSSVRCCGSIVALLVVIFFPSCRTREQDRQKADLERKKQTSQAIAAMAASHSAVIDWEERLEYPEFTVELHDIMAVSGRKILFVAAVDDIEGSSGNFFCRFSTHGAVDIVFLLKCSDGQVKSILQRAKEDWPGRYAVVAEVSEISKPLFRADVQSEDGDYPDQQLLVIENDTSFVARGNCADLLFVGDYEPE
jgi:hypothetical protein